MSFTDFSLHPTILKGVAELGFTEPTPIQASALPPALAGRDVLGCAMTGSGKTAAFVLPILERLRAKPNSGATRALILTPTRELALQVEEHLSALGRHTRVRSGTVIGGVNPRPQERILRAGVDVIVATPGRLLDHMGSGIARLGGVEILVLDEADRMLDMGFLPDVRRILAKIPRRRQTLLFSATLPRAIVGLSAEVLTDPVRLDVERPSAPAEGIAQQLLPVAEGLKRPLLLELLRRGEVQTALVFTRTKHRANRLAVYLDRAGIACDRIHGDRSQRQRQLALAAFKGGHLRILVATDIAARGIDVEALPHVINFDVPRQAEDYVHRVGRTARAGASGEALTFAAPEESGEVSAIERTIGRRIERRMLAGFDYGAKSSSGSSNPVARRITGGRVKGRPQAGRPAPRRGKTSGGNGGRRSRERKARV